MQLQNGIGLPPHSVAKQVRCVYGTRRVGSDREDVYHAKLEDMGFVWSEREALIHVGAPGSQETWPAPPPGSVKPYLEDESGSPQLCQRSEECLVGARCLDGVCVVDLDGGGCRTGAPLPGPGLTTCWIVMIAGLGRRRS